MAAYGNLFDYFFPTTADKNPEGTTTSSDSGINNMSELLPWTGNASGLSAPVIWDPKQLLFDKHHLESVQFCLKHPQYAAGNLEGHLLPGSMFIFTFCYYFWVLYSRYHKATARGSTYKFDGSLGRMAVPWNPKKSYGFYFLFVLVVHSIMSSTTHNHADEVYLPSVWARVVDYYTTDPHFSMLAMFMVGTIVDYLEPKRRLRIPQKTSCVFFALAFFALTGALFFHGLAPKCAYSGRVHLVFIFFPSLMTFVSIVAQLRNPSSFFLAVNTAYWGCFVGIGYLATGALCFPVAPGHKYLDTDHPSVKMSKIPYQFLLTFTYSIFILLVAFFGLFSVFRGSKLGTRNPDYYVHDDEKDTPADEYHLCGSAEKKQLLQQSSEDESCCLSF